MKTRRIIILALIATLYTGVGLLLAPFSFGNIQVRVAEALSLLPVLLPGSVYALTLGCFLTNLIGFSMGANMLGVLDVICGTVTTLVAALCTRHLARYRIKGYPVLSALPPVLLNALVIGWELTMVYQPAGNLSLSFFLVMFTEVFIGQFVAVFIMGLPLIRKLEESGLLSDKEQKKSVG